MPLPSLHKQKQNRAEHMNVACIVNSCENYWFSIRTIWSRYLYFSLKIRLFFRIHKYFSFLSPSTMDEKKLFAFRVNEPFVARPRRFSSTRATPELRRYYGNKLEISSRFDLKNFLGNRLLKVFRCFAGSKCGLPFSNHWFHCRKSF